MTSVPLPEPIKNCPLVIIDVVKGCCNKEYEAPEWNFRARARSGAPQRAEYQEYLYNQILSIAEK